MTADSVEPVMTKSQNKHNRIHGTGGPLHDELTLLIESNEISPTQDIKIRGKRLSDEFGW